MNDLVSIIMTAYNSENTIEYALDSVIQQTYQFYELIIVDDCSKDNTFSIISKYEKEYKNIKVIKNIKNLGIAKSRKKALQESTGRWIAILDSDDIWEKDKLYKQMELILNNNNIKIVYTGSSFIDKNGKKINWIFNVPNKITYKELLKENIISNSSVVVLKEEYLLNFVEIDNLHEDYAIWLKMLKKGEIAYGINEPLLVYRININSKSGNKFKSALMNYRTLKYTGLSYIEVLKYMVCYCYYGLVKFFNIYFDRG